MKLLEYLRRNIIEQGESDINSQEIEYGKAIVKSTPFNVSAAASCEAMKSSLKNNGIPFAKVGKEDTIKLPGVTTDQKKDKNKSKKVKFDTQQRFIEWYSNVITSPDSPQVRGKIFEGLIGGVFGGTVTGNESKTGEELKDKTDVIAQGKKISVKFSVDGFGNELPLASIAKNVKNEIDVINNDFDRSLYSQDEINAINKILIKKRKSVLSALKLGGESGVTTKNLMEILRGTEEGKKFIERVLKESAFTEIEYFMGGERGDINEINVSQYRTLDIIESVIKGNFKMNGNSIVATQLQLIPKKILKIEFPQYTKTKRIKYEISVKNKNLNISDKNTNSAYILRNGEVVGYVTRKIMDGNIIYNVSSYGVNLSPDLRGEAINKALMSDIKKSEILKIDYPDIDNSKLKQKMIDLSKTLSRELFMTKSKIGGENSVEGSISQLVGGERQGTLNPAVIQNIRKNPDRFLQRFLEIYKNNPERLKKFKEIISNF
jgi:hypothetical protein